MDANRVLWLIVVGGPTASGKTDLAIRLARHFDTEIISADSRQFYRQMDIGTAKPSPDELALVPHHFINSLDIHQPYTVADFEKQALALLDRLFARQDTVIVAGGSGLFIRALTEGLDEFPATSPSAAAWVKAGEQTGGLAWLQEQLQILDPGYYQRVDLQNPARLRRALEVCRSSGKPYSSFLTRTPKIRNFTPVYLLLDPGREALYARINQRVDDMVARGLFEEARLLYPYRHLSALKTVGYEECFAYFEKQYSLEEAIDKIKQHTRNYAKRQLTWFRKHGDWKTFEPGDMESVMAWLEACGIK